MLHSRSLRVCLLSLITLSYGGVAAHMSAIYKHGPCPIHRQTFAPMKHMKPKAKTDAKAAAALGEDEGAKKTTATKGKKAAAVTASAAAEAKATPAGRRRSTRK